DPATRPVLLGLLADGEGVEVPPRERGGMGDRVGDGVGAEREPAHRVRLPSGIVDGFKTQSSNSHLTLAAHGGAARVDVEIRAPPAREHEVTGPDGALEEQLTKSIPVVHEAVASFHHSKDPGNHQNVTANTDPDGLNTRDGGTSCRGKRAPARDAISSSRILHGGSERVR